MRVPEEKIKALLIEKGLEPETAETVCFVLYNSTMNGLTGALTPNKQFTPKEQERYDAGKGLASKLLGMMIRAGY